MVIKKERKKERQANKTAAKVLKAPSVVVPATVRLSRTTFCHDDAKRTSHIVAAIIKSFVLSTGILHRHLSLFLLSSISFGKTRGKTSLFVSSCKQTLNETKPLKLNSCGNITSPSGER